MRSVRGHIGDDYAVTVIRHLGDDATCRVDDHATARVIDRSLVAGFGRCHQPDAVLVGPGRSPHLSLIHGEEVCHIDNNLSSLQREAASDLRNASVEADHQPDPPKIGIDNRTTALTKGKPILVMRCKKLLVIMDGELAFAIK